MAVEQTLQVKIRQPGKVEGRECLALGKDAHIRHQRAVQFPGIGAQRGRGDFKRGTRVNEERHGIFCRPAIDGRDTRQRFRGDRQLTPDAALGFETIGNIVAERHFPIPASRIQRPDWKHLLIDQFRDGARQDGLVGTTPELAGDGSPLGQRAE